MGFAEDARGVQEDVAAVFELSGLLAREDLAEFDSPFALVLVPVATGHLGVEGHVLAEVEDVAHLVEVCPQVGGVRVEARPVGVLDSAVSARSPTAHLRRYIPRRTDRCRHGWGHHTQL